MPFRKTLKLFSRSVKKWTAKASYKYLAGLLVVFVFLSLMPSSAYPGSSYPRLANYFLKWTISDEEVGELGKWDLLILDMETGVNSREQLEAIRRHNPGITILAYVSCMETRNDIQGNGHARLREEILNQLDDSWWLRDTAGAHVSFWPNNWMLNPSSLASANDQGVTWREFLPGFVSDRILATGLWDGVFYDNLWAEPSWSVPADTDLDGDGRAEGRETLDRSWQEGMTEMLEESRRLFGGRYLIVANARGFAGYQKYLNGMMIESFPSIWGEAGEWAGSMEAYIEFSALNQAPKTFVINANTGNRNDPADYQAMRFGLASALLGDGYYSFDFGTEAHNQTWYYDEYRADLGQPVGAAYRLDGASAEWMPGFWRRDFEKGIVLVNSADVPKQTDLSAENLYFLNGEQDAQANNGRKAGVVEIPAEDGRLFVGTPSRRQIDNTPKPQQEQGPEYEKRPVSGGDYTVGLPLYERPSQNAPTDSVPAGIFTPEPGIVLGQGARVLKANIDFDEAEESIVSENGEIQIFKGKRRVLTFYPFGRSYQGKISFDVADLNGDGSKEIIVGAGPGGGPQVRIFNYSGTPLTGGFFAYDKNFRGGVNLAVMDLNGDATLEIITGAGPGGGPHIRTFSKDGQALTGGFMAYDPASRHGVSVAVGDVGFDSEKEIVTAPGPGGNPVIKIFSKDGTYLDSFRDDRLGKGGTELLIEKNEVAGEKDVIYSMPWGR